MNVEICFRYGKNLLTMLSLDNIAYEIDKAALSKAERQSLEM